MILALSSNLLYQTPVDRSSGRTTDAARQVLFERLLLELTNLHSHAADYALRSGGVRIFQILVMGYDELLWCRLQRIWNRHEPVKVMLDAVIAVITRGEKVLLIQRAANIRGGGRWAPVSGEVEPGESQETAVAREAMEEVGLTVRPIRKVWENVSTRGTFILHWWIAEYIGGELALNAAEVSDARWLTVDEICRLEGTFEGDREFYRKILPTVAS